MPILKINHVVSYSSEDGTHVSENLLSSDPAKKWKCATPGEKSATVVLQLDKASKISGIDIGNEHSAYIEVLVSRSGSAVNDFKVLLVMSSFMNPTESRQSTNINKVRMFTAEHLSKPVCDEKWDLIKIVCTQPFNRHVQYGLSFITFHTPELTDNTTDLTQTLGKFTVRQPSPDDLSVGSLFARRNQHKEKDPPPTAAVAIRQSSETPNGSPSSRHKTKFTVTHNERKSPQRTPSDSKMLPSRNRDELLYSDDEMRANKKIDKIIEMKKNETDAIKKQKVEEKSDKKKKKKETGTPTPSKKKDTPLTVESSKRKSPSTPTTAKKKPKINRARKSFDRLLDGVVLVISGIQNPDRANLRSAALLMGAKYKADWDNTCTHLICAFPNTPKFNQVKGKGKIVTKKWIEECASQRKRLPWRRYALDKNDQGKNESEEEIWEKTEEDEDSPQINTDTDDIEDEPQREVGSDTEEQIARIQQQKAEDRDEEDENKNDPFEAETDHDSENSRICDLELPDALPTFFNEKNFYVDKDSFEEKDTELIKRYIVAYKGNVCENFSKFIDLVVTKDAKNYPSKVCVSPEWVWACHNLQEMLPTDDYLVT